MKYSEVIAEVRGLYPNEYSDEQFEKWMAELENKIANFRGTQNIRSIDPEREVSCGIPFDRMYVDFLMAQIALHQHDDDDYVRYMRVFNSRFDEWKAFYIRNYEGEKRQFRNWI